jgi:hypothetical protein
MEGICRGRQANRAAVPKKTPDGDFMVVAFYRVYKIYMIEKPALHSCKSFDHPAAGRGTAYP